MNAVVRDLVRRRAGYRCEYCAMLQDHDPLFLHHIEHVVAKQHGGGDDQENLALACYHCNLHKGPNLTGIDPDTGAITVLFHPRRQPWQDHFALQGPLVVGLTATGRTTVRVLNMNAPNRVDLRLYLLVRGEL